MRSVTRSVSRYLSATKLASVIMSRMTRVASGEERTPRTLFAQVSGLSYASAPLHSAAHSRVYAVRAPLKRRRLRSLRAERGRLCPRVPSVDTLGRAP